MTTILILKNKKQREEIVLDSMVPIKFEMSTGNITFVPTMLVSGQEQQCSRITKAINLSFGVVLADAYGLIEVKLHSDTVAFVSQRIDK